MTPPPEPITADTALRLLAERRRRQVLRQLADTDTPTTIDRLGEAILAAVGSETDITEEGLAIQLHHIHLPKLQEVGVIEYDQRGGTVRRGPQFRDTLALCRAIQQHREEFVERDRHRTT